MIWKLFIEDGRSRGSKSLAAITGLASLMFISTLGQEPNNVPEPDDNLNMYSDLLKEIMTDEETDVEQTTTETYESMVK